MKVIVFIVMVIVLFKLTDAVTHSIQREGKKVNACLFNPAYQGSTPEATRYLYNKCKANH